MKWSIKSPDPQPMKPVTLSITVETRQEALFMLDMIDYMNSCPSPIGMGPCLKDLHKALKGAIA